MLMTREYKQRKNSQTPAATSEPFDFESEGYSLRVQDWGEGGVKLELTRPRDVAPYWDIASAVRLPSRTVDELINWLCITVARPYLTLPEETLSVLSGVVTKLTEDREIPEADIAVLKRAVSALRNLYEGASKIQRSINR